MVAGPGGTETFSQQLTNKGCLKITYATCSPCDLMVRPIAEGITPINHRPLRNKGNFLLLVLIGKKPTLRDVKIDKAGGWPAAGERC